MFEEMGLALPTLTQVAVLLGKWPTASALGIVSLSIAAAVAYDRKQRVYCRVASSLLFGLLCVVIVGFLLPIIAVTEQL